MPIATTTLPRPFGSYRTVDANHLLDARPSLALARFFWFPARAPYLRTPYVVVDFCRSSASKRLSLGIEFFAPYASGDSARTLSVRTLGALSPFTDAGLLQGAFR